jgi:hypothetical protein
VQPIGRRGKRGYGVRSEPNRWLVLVLVCISQFMVVLDATIVNYHVAFAVGAAMLFGVLLVLAMTIRARDVEQIDHGGSA